jgi:hypothetical protein
MIKLMIHPRLLNEIFTFFNTEIFHPSHPVHLIQTIDYLLLVYHRITMNRLELQTNPSFELLFNAMGKCLSSEFTTMLLWE